MDRSLAAVAGPATAMALNVGVDQYTGPVCSFDVHSIGTDQASGKVPSLPKKSVVGGGAISCEHILVSCFTCTTHGDLV